MKELNEVIDSIRSYLEEKDFIIQVNGDAIVCRHKDIPIFLDIRIRDKNAIIQLRVSSEELREYLEEQVESGENVVELVDEYLSEIRDTAIDISRLLKKKRWNVSIDLREGESDVRDLLEEIIEEHSIF